MRLNTEVCGWASAGQTLVSRGAPSPQKISCFMFGFCLGNGCMPEADVKPQAVRSAPRQRQSSPTTMPTTTPRPTPTPMCTCTRAQCMRARGQRVYRAVVATVPRRGSPQPGGGATAPLPVTGSASLPRVGASFAPRRRTQPADALRRCSGTWLPLSSTRSTSCGSPGVVSEAEQEAFPGRRLPTC